MISCSFYNLISLQTSHPMIVSSSYSSITLISHGIDSLTDWFLGRSSRTYSEWFLKSCVSRWSVVNLSRSLHRWNETHNICSHLRRAPFNRVRCSTRIFKSPPKGNSYDSRLGLTGPPGALTSFDLPGLRYRTRTDLQAGIQARLWSSS